MKNPTNAYQILEKYCLRTSLFPFSFYKEVLQTNLDYKNTFQKLLQNTVFREAIYLASPELYTQIVKWEQGLLKDTRKIERLQFSILKYATRITSRCTPFGLFASCNTGSFGMETKIALKEYKTYRRHTRFDMSFLTLL